MTLIIKLSSGLASSTSSLMLCVVLNSLQGFQIFIVFQSIRKMPGNLVICFEYQQRLTKENCFRLLEGVDFVYPIKNF